MGTTAKKSAVKKTAPKKTVAKKATAKKKAAVKKLPTKRTATKKATTKKTAAKKAAVKKPISSQDEVGKISEENLQAMAADIDRQMEMLAEMNTRVVIAKDQLADFQENISSRITAFKKRNAGKP